LARAASAGGRAAAIDDALPQYIYIYIDMPVRTYSSHICAHTHFSETCDAESGVFCAGGARRAHAAPFYCTHLTHMHTPHQKDDPRTPPHDHALNNPTDQLSAGASSAISHKNGLGDSKFVYARHEITCSFVAHRVVAWAKKAQSSTNTLHRRQSELHVPSDLPHISSLRSGTCSKPFWEGELRPMAAFPAFLSSAGVT
jgi:hypothetical protein